MTNFSYELDKLLETTSNYDGLQLEGKELSKQDLESIKNAVNDGNLTHLVLIDNNFDIGHIRVIGDIIKTNKIKLLSVKGNKITPEGIKILADAIKINSSLTRLDLSNNSLKDNGTAYLVNALKENESIVDLLLCNNNIGNIGAKAIGSLLTTNSIIKNLFLEANEIEDEGAVAIAGSLKKHPSVIELDLNNNNIGDEGATNLADILNFTKFSCLKLNKNNIGTAGINALKAKAFNPYHRIKLEIANQVHEEEMTESYTTPGFIEMKLTPDKALSGLLDIWNQKLARDAIPGTNTEMKINMQVKLLPVKGDADTILNQMTGASLQNNDITKKDTPCDFHYVVATDEFVASLSGDISMTEI